MQHEIKATAFLIDALVKLADDVETVVGIFGLLRQWEAETFEDLHKDGTVECGRYKLELTWWYESFFGQGERHRAVVILDSASGKSLTIPDYDDWPDDLPDDYDLADYGVPIQSEKPRCRWKRDAGGRGDSRTFEPYIGDWSTRLPRIHVPRRSDRP